MEPNLKGGGVLYSGGGVGFGKNANRLYEFKGRGGRGGPQKIPGGAGGVG